MNYSSPPIGRPARRAITPHWPPGAHLQVAVVAAGVHLITGVHVEHRVETLGGAGVLLGLLHLAGGGEEEEEEGADGQNEEDEEDQHLESGEGFGRSERRPRRREKVGKKMTKRNKSTL